MLKGQISKLLLGSRSGASSPCSSPVRPFFINPVRNNEIKYKYSSRRVEQKNDEKKKRLAVAAHDPKKPPPRCPPQIGSIPGIPNAPPTVYYSSSFFSFSFFFSFYCSAYESRPYRSLLLAYECTAPLFFGFSDCPAPPVEEAEAEEEEENAGDRGILIAFRGAAAGLSFTRGLSPGYKSQQPGLAHLSC